MFVVAVAGCDDAADPVVVDSGGKPEAAVADRGAVVDRGSSTIDRGQLDQPGAADKTVADASRGDRPWSPDIAAPDRGPVKDRAVMDQGPCQKSGQPCDKNKVSCCKGLICCSGMPIPPGKEFCATSCPVSDRALKHSRRPLTPDEVLGRLSTLPMSSWSYNNEPPTTRHMGPMAQDFAATFGLGADERFIAPPDAHGVAFVAIQALHRKVEALARQLESLRRDNRRLQERCGRHNVN